MSIYWTCGSGYVELEFESIEQCESCSHPGPCDQDVEALSTDAFIRAQLDAMDPEGLRKTLREYGAWSKEELEDHEQNLQRILWIATGDVSDSPENYTFTE